MSEARAALPAILDKVMAGDEVTITRHGRPVAVIVRHDALRARRADEALAAAERIQSVITEGRKSRLRRKPSIREDRAAELIADVRAARSTR